MCASRAVTFLSDLSLVSEYFQDWRPLGRRRPEAVQATPVVLSVNAFVELFAKGQNRRDVGGDVINELGFRISVWNGRGDETASSLTMSCGIYSTVSGLSNAVVLKIPSQLDVNATNQVRQIILALSQAWEPDWAIVAAQTRVTQQAGAGPFLDRALYIRSSAKLPNDIPISAKRETLKDGLLLLARRH